MKNDRPVNQLGSEDMHNLVKMHGHMHRRSKVGVHQHILEKLELKSIHELYDLWEAALKSPTEAARQRLAQDILNAYRSFFALSPNAERIIAIFKNALASFVK